MNYKKIYFQIIHNRLANPLPLSVYGEKHHIIPRSFGGSDRKSNLVRLTAKEHYLCHFLLYKMLKKRYQMFGSQKSKKRYQKMLYAFQMMNCKNNLQNREHKTGGDIYKKVKAEAAKEKTIYSQEIICNMVASYVNGVNLSTINKDNQTNLSYAAFLKQVNKYGLSLNGDGKFKKQHDVKAMFDFYIKHHDVIKSDYGFFQKHFNYQSSRKMLYKLFQRNGLSIRKASI